MEKIDFVLTWVDGSDPNWQREYQKYVGDKKINFAHYRDYGTLKYWFRAVEKYAPWVNKIHFVTCGQIPEWLNVNHPKLHCVSHADYMPAEYLPTFSANPIELNFHRIEGLAEHFVYFNDDTFITAPVTEEDFFKEGLPCDTALFSALIPSEKNDIITNILFNDLLLINCNFSKRQALRHQLRKWINFKYGKLIIKNIYYMPIGKFTGFTNPHLPNSFLKSTFEEVWNKERDYLDAVCQNRFRAKEDVNQYLMRYWQLVQGKFTPRGLDVGRSLLIGDDDIQIDVCIRQQHYKMLCINDNPYDNNFELNQGKLTSSFEVVLSQKSSFEC